MIGVFGLVFMVIAYSFFFFKRTTPFIALNLISNLLLVIHATLLQDYILAIGNSFISFVLICRLYNAFFFNEQ